MTQYSNASLNRASYWAFLSAVALEEMSVIFRHILNVSPSVLVDPLGAALFLVILSAVIWTSALRPPSVFRPLKPGPTGF